MASNALFPQSLMRGWVGQFLLKTQGLLLVEFNSLFISGSTGIGLEPADRRWHDWPMHGIAAQASQA